MGVNRRGFCKIAGVTALGLACKPAVEAVANQLLPEESPLEAGRWAMVIDVKKCLKDEGCTDCIDVCHRIHNVPDYGNEKDAIKWIWKETFEHAFPEQHHEFTMEHLKHSPVLVLCNHCDNPPCVRVCPTQATWKRKKDGIVMMDWHRCIGCRYCVVACPYGSRSFNWREPQEPYIKKLDPRFPKRTRGVVEKCTFCEERLARGQLPACVLACQEKALVFGDLEDPKSEVRRLLRSHYTIRRKPGLGTKPDVFYIV